MLKNASSLAIVGLDTAENGPSKVRQVTNRIEAIIGPGRVRRSQERAVPGGERRRREGGGEDRLQRALLQGRAAPVRGLRHRDTRLPPDR